MTTRIPPCGNRTRPSRVSPPPIGEIKDKEKAAARDLAAELNRITAVVGRDSGRCLPERSLAAGVATRLACLEPEAHKRIVDMAAGDRRGAEAPAGGESLDLDPSVVKQLRSSLRERLEALRPDLRATLERTVRDRGGLQELGATAATKVELKIAGEPDSSWRREINMAFPELLDFRWNTQEPGAARGYWELRGPVVPGHAGNVIAGGYLPDIPGDDAVGGYFTIAMRKYLPPTPPPTANTYHLRVLPLAAPGVGWGYQADVGNGALGSLSPFQPVAPEGIGPWSGPAVIRYGLDFQQGPQHFDIQQMDVYRRAHYHFDWFRLVQDQAGPGDEEFHISGFVVEHTPQGAVEHGRIGPSSFTVDPDDRSKHPFGKRASVWLGTPNQTYWPRALTAVVSIMEEDDGGMMTEWHASIERLLHEMLHDEFAADVRDFLRSMREEIADAQAELAAEMAAEIASFIATAVAATAREVITAYIALVVAWILAFVRTGAGDDFYGTQVFTLFLTSSDAARIADGSAGEIITSHLPAGGGSFAGSEQPDGSFRMQETELQFLGLGSGEEGSPVSGIVNVAMHWEFDDKVTVYA